MDSFLPIFLTLVVGLVAGFAIGYFVVRRTGGSATMSSAARDADKALRRLNGESPKFFAAIKDDLTRPEFADVREFAIVSSSDVTFVSEELRFVYYEDEVPNLRGIAETLENNGFVDEITSGRTPIFRMRERFIEILGSL